MYRAFAERRRQVLKDMGQGLMVVFSAPTAIRNNDVEHEYRQDSDFYYLTGFDEPESMLVLQAGETQSYTLFVRPKDALRETWDGERLGVDGAIARLGADFAFGVDEFASKLLEMLKGHSQLFYAIGRVSEHDCTVLTAIRKLRERSRRGDKGPTAILEPSTILHEMRLRKSTEEVEQLSRAIEITCSGHHALYERTRPGMGEYELEGILRERFRALGSERCAYSPIVASGRNGRILHHRRNDRLIGDGDLVLVDAGAEFGYFAADITRTYPASGKFTPLQRQAYEIVLSAQELGIAAAVVGATLDEVHNVAAKRLCAGLIELGILSGEVNDLWETDAFKRYYMHRTSHWLGMDVHDVGDYFLEGKPRPLEPGMALTVEPGLYFSADDPAVPEGLRDVGIRIEDDILVSAQGPINLSAAIVKSVRDIELMMAQGRGH